MFCRAACGMAPPSDEPPEQWGELWGRKVSSHGRIWGKKSGAPFDPKPNDHGYKRVLTEIGLRSVHVMVGTLFLDPPPSLENVEIDHKNRNRGDNWVSNLRWVTKSENCFNRAPSRPRSNVTPVEVSFGDGWVECRSIQEACRTFGFDSSSVMKVLKGEASQHHGAQIRYVQEPTPVGEEWRTVDGIPVSNRCRSRDRWGNSYTVRPQSGAGYSLLHNRQFHVLVCTAWHGPKPFPGAVVDHKDGIRSNNRPENLQWVTVQENNAKAARPNQTRVHTKKRVRYIDGDGHTEEFDSIVAASTKTGVPSCGISKAIRKRHRAGGLHWESV